MLGLSQVIQQLGQQFQQITSIPIQISTIAAVLPKQKFPKLIKFSGIYTEYKIGHEKAKLKLDIDNDAIGDNHIKIALLKTALVDIAVQNAIIFITKLKVRPDAMPKKLLEHLDLSGKNSHEAELALGKLQSMRQGNRPFHLFFAEFERIMADAEASEFPESSKKNYFKIVIAKYVKKLIYAQDELMTYEALMRLYLQIAIRQEQARKTKQTEEQEHDDSSEDGSSVMAKLIVEKNIINWKSISAVRIQAVNIDGHSTGPGLSNDVQYHGKHIYGMDDEERRKYHQEGCCLCYSRNDYCQNVCPLTAIYRPRPVRADRQQITETEVEDETETEKETFFR